MKSSYAIGLMSGTSADGLDIAYVKIIENNEINVQLINFKMVEYPKELRNKILRAINSDISIRFLCSLNFEIANFYALKVNEFIAEFNLDKNKIDFIASHGQTIYHLVDTKESEFQSTLQIGDISVLAKKTNIKVVGDFRPADMAVGGQGAPLVPLYDYCIFNDNNYVRLLQNIGGISNVSVIEKNINTIAFDNGPGNVLIDLAVKELFDLEFDLNGQIAQSGEVNNEIIKYLLNDSYYHLKPPKSTGREKYNKAFILSLIKKFSYLNKKDIITSLTYFTALIIAKSYRDFIFKNNKKYQIIVSGGGANNLFLFESLKKLLKEHEVYKIDYFGINSDAKEAMAFALLGYYCLNNYPANFPSVTGAKTKEILGKIAC